MSRRRLKLATQVVVGVAAMLSTLMIPPAFAGPSAQETSPSLDAVDVGLLNEQVEAILPDLVDEWADVAIGSCALSLGTPARSGAYISAGASMTCSESQRAASIQVCLQRRSLDRWVTLPESCRTGVSTSSSASATATTICNPGTWRYRLYALGEAVGSTINIVGQRGLVGRIECAIAATGEGNP